MKLPVVVLVVLVAAFGASLLFWYFAIFQGQAPEAAPPDTAVSPMCSGFAPVPGEISCDETISIAQAKYGGKAQGIIQGSAGFPEKEGAPPAVKSFWRIEILLDSPIQKDQETFNSARLYLDRKTSEELASGYTSRP